MSDKKVNIIDARDFKAEVLESAVPVIVDFYADWCGPCRAMEKTLADFAAAYEGRVKVVKVNVDQAADLCIEHNITSIPALLLFKDGAAAARLVGAQPRKALDKLAEGALQTDNVSHINKAKKPPQGPQL